MKRLLIVVGLLLLTVGSVRAAPGDLAGVGAVSVWVTDTSKKPANSKFDPIDMTETVKNHLKYGNVPVAENSIKPTADLDVRVNYLAIGDSGLYVYCVTVNLYEYAHPAYRPTKLIVESTWSGNYVGGAGDLRVSEGIKDAVTEVADAFVAQYKSDNPAKAARVSQKPVKVASSGAVRKNGSAN